MTSISSNYYLYVKNGEVKKDYDINSPSVFRWLKSYFDTRSYKWLDVLKNITTSSAYDLNEKDIALICKGASKSLHIHSNAIENYIHLCREFLERSSNGKIDNGAFSLFKEEFYKHKSNDLKQLKFFHHSNDQINKDSIVTECLNQAFFKKKWTELGLKAELADSCPDDVAFLIETRLIYSILGLQNSTENGKKEHEIQSWGNLDQPILGLKIKSKNNWVKISELINTLAFDLKEGMLTSQDNLREHWNYFSEGLIPVDRFHHHIHSHSEHYPVQNKFLHPIAKLSSIEMQKVLNKALLCDKENQNPQDLTAVIQFVSHPRPIFKTNLLKNLNSQIPVHCGIRVISSNGDVYSTGFGSTLDEDHYNSGPWKFLGSINGQPTNIDYEEFRMHEGRITTSIAVTQEAIEKILTRLNAYRDNGIRFNILKQNCMKLGTHILSYAGYKLDIKVSLGSMFYRCLPDLNQIPLIGKPLKNVYNWSSNFCIKISSLIPLVVKNIFNIIANTFFYLPRKCSTVLKNILVYTLGGKIGSPSIVNNSSQLYDPEIGIDPGYDPEEEDCLEDFKCLLGSLFDDHASDINHSSIFINWQLNQPSTEVHPYGRQPSMKILPLSEESAINFSLEKLIEFKDLYKYSLPS